MREFSLRYAQERGLPTGLPDFPAPPRVESSSKAQPRRPSWDIADGFGVTRYARTV
jgi:hypothetical protein